MGKHKSVWQLTVIYRRNECGHFIHFWSIRFHLQDKTSERIESGMALLMLSMCSQTKQCSVYVLRFKSEVKPDPPVTLAFSKSITGFVWSLLCVCVISVFQKCFFVMSQCHISPLINVSPKWSLRAVWRMKFVERGGIEIDSQAYLSLHLRWLDKGLNIQSFMLKITQCYDGVHLCAFDNNK